MDFPESFKNDFDRKGYAVVSNVFSEREIATLREKTLQSEQQNVCGELLSNSMFSSLVYDNRVLSIARALLRSNELVYLADGTWTIQRNTTFPQLFHKDSADRFDGNAPDWTQPYHLIRLGIYLQDHSEHSGGLSVYEGSHSLGCVREGKVITKWGKFVRLKITPGDVVAWSLKTSHSGNWGIPRTPLMDLLPLKIIKGLHVLKFLFKPQHDFRAAVFLSYGVAGSPSATRYGQYLRVRDFGYDAVKNINHDPALIARLKAEKNLEVFDMHAIMKGVRREEVGSHREIPY